MADNTAHHPAPPDARSPRGGCIIKVVATAVGIIVLCSLFSAWFIPYAQYKSSHDIPNPFWGVFGKTVTYTPEQGPPSPDLVDSRPEAVVLQYIADYQKLADTYPCAQDLANYQEGMDPVLIGRPCSVHRPVASVVVRSVLLGAEHTTRVVAAPIQSPEAYVHLLITYADSTQFAMTLPVQPYRHQIYFLTYLHQDCWSSLGIISLYPQLVAQAPKGANYGVDDQGNPLCQR